MNVQDTPFANGVRTTATSATTSGLTALFLVFFGVVSYVVRVMPASECTLVAASYTAVPIGPA